MRNLLGGKGANLAEMCKLGIPVPAGFTITTECCTEYYKLGTQYPKELKAEVDAALAATEAIMGKKFGDPNDPLLVSCRSGARSSMPGMMETVLNIGLCSATIPGLIAKTQNPRFVYDAYRRLIMMYSDVVMEKAGKADPAREAYERDTDIVTYVPFIQTAPDALLGDATIGTAEKGRQIVEKCVDRIVEYMKAEFEC